ncbi:MAG: arylsulfotransferase family protein [Pseudomonadota bacterium]
MLKSLFSMLQDLFGRDPGALEDSEDATARLVFLGAVAAIVFIAGMATAHYRFFPYTTFVSARIALADLRSNWASDTGIRPTRFLQPLAGEKSGTTVHNPDISADGYTLISGLFDDNVAARLIDMDGNTIRQWDYPFDLVSAEAAAIPPVPAPTDQWSYQITGTVLLEDASLIVNVGSMYMKMDSCGNHLWTAPVRGHHAVFKDSDGTFWGLGERHYTPPPERWLSRVDSMRDDTVLHISENGEVLSEVSLWDVMLQNDLHAIMGANGEAPSLQGGAFTSDDPMHANDIEVLSETAAAGIPLARAGDVMVSARNLNLVIIFDPETLDVHWWQVGPWNRQHDPDIMSDGRISVFNNNRDKQEFGGSSILAIHPITREIEKLYPLSEENEFYTQCCGMHQHLENDNILITIEQEGRLLETTRAGETAWEHVVRYDPEHVVKIFDGVRYPAEHFLADAFGVCDD